MLIMFARGVEYHQVGCARSNSFHDEIEAKQPQDEDTQVVDAEGNANANTTGLSVRPRFYLVPPNIFRKLRIACTWATRCLCRTQLAIFDVENSMLLLLLAYRHW